MIESLRGTLLARQPARLLISVGGVGFGVDVSLRTAERFPRPGETVELATWLHVKEDLLELYGFADEAERGVFLKLISVSGIGPRMALRILSSTTPQELARMIRDADVRGLTALKGIGKKTAEVMIANLKGSLSKLDLAGVAGTAAPSPDDGSESVRDAIQALVTLGVKDSAAQAAVQKAARKLGAQADASRLIAQALQEV